MANNKILIIAGMHRSGTSLITQWLFRCGLHVGERMLGPLTGNEEGHFEDLDFVDTHKDILKEQQLPDTGLTMLPVEKIPSQQKQKLKEIIFLKNQINNQWGWKDPRTCLFLPVYRELIPAANYFFIIRDFASSVSSLINRIYQQAEKKYLARSRFSAFLWKTIRRKLRKRRLYKKFAESYLKVWIAYNEQILQTINLLSRNDFLLVDYTMLHEKDQYIFSHLKNTWNFSLNYYNFSNVFKGNLMSTPGDIGPYIKNKSLLVRAQKIEEHLRSFSY